jgi:hypothetical protein
VEKMDHHCVWTDRCIGYWNYKSFLQFIGYLTLGAFVYDYLAINFLSRSMAEFNIFLLLFVYLETALVFLTTLLAGCLLTAHLLMMAINLSTLEYMQGKPFRFFWAIDDELVKAI